MADFLEEVRVVGRDKVVNPGLDADPSERVTVEVDVEVVDLGREGFRVRLHPSLRLLANIRRITPMIAHLRHSLRVVIFPRECTTEFVGCTIDVQASRVRVADLLEVELPYLQGKAGLMECAVDGRFG